MPDYLDFELNIETLDTMVENGRLRIRVANSPVGSVETVIQNTLTTAEIQQIVGVLEGTINVSRSDRDRLARTFGEKLFNLIFSTQIYAAYLTSLQQAGNNGLRIKLTLEDAGTLADLPWELLRDPRTDYLVLSRQTPLVRFPRILTIRPLVEISLPLRVLVLISSPTDQAKLDVEDEWRSLQDATAELRNRGLLELERLDNAQLITLQRKLRSGVAYQIFHYIGHSTFDDRSQLGMLAFEDPKDQSTIPVSGEALARELSEENSIRLVVMNACQGARQNLKDPFSGIASSLVARGVPAVVGMQFAISDDASRVFSQEFYRVLSEGYPIEAGVAESRRAISSTLNNLEWATPVLYLRAPTGYLFPKRHSSDPITAAGGLREKLRLMLPVLGIILIIAVLFLGRAVLASVPATPEFKDADLALKSVSFFPPQPNISPGKLITVSVRIVNIGKGQSGPFSWEWFSIYNREDPKPVVLKSVDNIQPGVVFFDKDSFILPGWGSFSGLVWVNRGNKQPVEQNLFNNLQTVTIETNHDPLVIDFSFLPNAQGPESDMVLTGTEYSPWGIVIHAQTKDQQCSKAVPRLSQNADDGRYRLVVSLPDNPVVCTGDPLEFTIGKPAGEVPPDSISGTLPVGNVAVSFLPNTPGTYQLSWVNGTATAPASPNSVKVVDADMVRAGQPIQLSVDPPPNTAMTNTKVILTVPNKAATVVTDITLSPLISAP